MPFQTFDIILLLPILYGMVRGLLRGFSREITSLLAIAIGIIASKRLAPVFALRILEIVQMPDWAGRALSYILVFVGVSLGCQMLGRVMQKFLRAIALHWLDKLLGGLFGALKWALILSVILNLLLFIDPYYELIQPSAKASSRTYQPILKIAHVTWDKANELLPVAREQLGQSGADD